MAAGTANPAQPAMPARHPVDGVASRVPGQPGTPRTFVATPLAGILLIFCGRQHRRCRARSGSRLERVREVPATCRSRVSGKRIITNCSFFLALALIDQENCNFRSLPKLVYKFLIIIKLRS